MAVPVIMPKFEMSQETGTLIEWNKQEGDTIEKGETLLSVETDKLTMDVESPGSGILAGVKAKAGDVVPVTTTIAYLLEPGEELPAEAVEKVAAPVKEAKKAPPAAPKPAQAAVDATPLARRVAQTEGVDLQQVRGSGPAGRITRTDVENVLSAGTQGSAAVDGKVRATPAARRVARERSLDLKDIPGSGPRGRVQEEDVLQFRPAMVTTVASVSDALPEVLPFEGMRRKIADRLQASYQTAPHIMFTVKVDMSALDELRAMMNEKAKAMNTQRVSVTALMVKVVAWALQQNPWLNSSLQGEEIHLIKDVNVGVAVAISDGLIVPVVRQAQLKSVSQIAVEVKDLTERARANTLVPADVTGGTFTISNLGPFGIEQFTAIINPGQAAILAVGATQQEMVVIDGEAVIRPIMRMTLSADHRLIDGAVAAQFMSDLRQALESPAMILW